MVYLLIESSNLVISKFCSNYFYFTHFLRQYLMNPLELAEKYMDCVFKTGDLEALRKIFSDDLKFSGPFYNFDSADDYVNALRNNPPENFKYKIIKSYFDNHSA